MNREEIIAKIENNDPKILGELADIILLCREKINYKEIKFTDKDLNKQLRTRLKKCLPV